MLYDVECANLLIKLKEYLRSGKYHNEEKEIDYILCQYDSKNSQTQKQYLKNIITLCSNQAYGKLYIPNIDYSIWIDFLAGIRNIFKTYLLELERKIEALPISEIAYSGKKFDILIDAIEWIQTNNVLIVLLKCNEKYFPDNIAAFDFEGNYLWSTKDTIDVKNRDGAVFIGLQQITKESVCASAWVGINYELDVGTGKILNKVITK